MKSNWYRFAHGALELKIKPLVSNSQVGLLLYITNVIVEYVTYCKSFLEVLLFLIGVRIMLLSIKE